MNLKQFKLTNFFKKDKQRSSDDSDAEESESIYVPSKQKGKFDTPMSWTRVKEVATAGQKRMTIFDVEADLNADRSLKQIRKGSAREIGTMLFDPYSYDAEKE